MSIAKRGGGAARGEGPAILHFESLDVNVERFVFLFEIDVEIALAVGGTVFGAAAEINGACDGAVGGIEDADAVAFAVHDVEALGERFVDDGVGLLAYFDFGKGFERFQVEGNDGIGFAGGDVAAAEFGGDGLHRGRPGVWNGAHEGQRVRIHHVNLGGVSDVDAAGGFVDDDVIPAARARDSHFFQKLIIRSGACQGTQQRCATRNSITNRFIVLSLSYRFTCLRINAG